MFVWSSELSKVDELNENRTGDKVNEMPKPKRCLRRETYSQYKGDMRTSDDEEVELKDILLMLIEQVARAARKFHVVVKYNPKTHCAIIGCREYAIFSQWII